MTIQMRALTLWQPWAHLVSRGEKLIENRTWEPPAWMLGQDFAIHAGKKWDKERSDFINEVHGSPIGREEVSFGAIVGIANLSAVVTSSEAAERMVPGHGKWFMGPFGWVLRDVRMVRPAIECRGYQMLWRLPMDIQEQVEETA